MNDSKRYIFKVDATLSTGAGHFKRCLTIAHELDFNRSSIVFVGRFEIPWIIDDLNLNSIEYLDSMNFSSKNNDILILDQYEIDFEFLSNNKFQQTIQIVDTASPLIDANLFLHLGSDTSFLKSKIKDGKVLGGLNYLAVRGFNNNENTKVNISAKNLLIVGGGTDIHNFSESIIKALESVEKQNIEIHIMSNELFNNHKGLANNFHFHKLGGELDNLMSDVDTVITTAGTSSWDFIANQKVVGIALAVENQIPNFTFQIENNLALNIGNYKSGIGWQILPEAITNLIFNNELRSKLLKNSSSMVDLDGPKRVAAEIIELTKSL